MATETSGSGAPVEPTKSRVLLATELLCVALCVAGIWLRVQALGDPPGLTWDEHHFVKNAFNYLAGKPDWNDHPPLGKLLMALCIRVFGPQASSFRLPSVVLGIGSIAVAGALAKHIFRLPRAGLVAATLLSIDGFFISYSRTALLDGMLTFTVLLTTYLALRARGAGGMLVASLAAGAAISLKTSGVLALIPIAYACLRARRPLWLATTAAVPVVFYMQWAYGLWLTGKPYGPLDAWHVQVALMEHHAGLTEMKHPLTSRWYTWLIPLRTIPLRFEALAGDQVRVMNSLGHPLLWWATSLAVMGMSVRLFLRGAVPELRGPIPTTVQGFFELRRPLTEMLLMWWIFMAPWLLTRRDSYIYHYLPSYAFGLLLCAGGLAYLCREKPRLGLATCSTLAVVFVLYAPIWGQLPISRAGLDARLFLQGWR